MSIWIVQKQMIVIFVMILIGAYLYKKKHLSNESSKDLSWLIVNVTNPITLLCSALSEEEKVSAGELGIAFLSFAVMYAILIPLAYLIPMLLNVDRDRRYAYRMLAIFGNVGFIGIPFASAVLGPKSLIFVSICCLVFNIIIYTYGAASLKAVAEEQHPDEDKGDAFSAKNSINLCRKRKVCICSSCLTRCICTEELVLKCSKSCLAEIAVLRNVVNKVEVRVAAAEELIVIDEVIYNAVMHIFHDAYVI